MKKTLVYSKRFRQDYRRFLHQPKRLIALNEVLRLLENGKPLPETMRPHMLHGEYDGCWECHVQGNFLLIWIDEEVNVIRLLRLGTHHELFGL